MAISGAETQSNSATKPGPQVEVESIKCYSCGFREECTPAYISRVRERYHGRWICGLCIEAVKDEVLRSDRLISTEEALNRHISFCNKFRSCTPDNQTEHPIVVMGRILRRSLDSPRAIRSNSSSVLPEVDVEKIKYMWKSRMTE
ncbi:uncharacterized protein LOC110604117 [Manihot esculenta]|uniref:Uncharacterized protein n=1 Tax=Manihot esculenta TaxID=3983 RepID=A0ACB7G728_MANES|nr:uncharacterized protein LOC110604117 [Manihot esculenta]KAG8636062.1 hypothetical protein MANES_16G094402v8 [Manihot esculenta]